MRFWGKAKQSLKVNYYEPQWGGDGSILVRFRMNLALELLQTIPFLFNLSSLSLFLQVVY